MQGQSPRSSRDTTVRRDVSTGSSLKRGCARLTLSIILGIAMLPSCPAFRISTGASVRLFVAQSRASGHAAARGGTCSPRGSQDGLHRVAGDRARVGVRSRDGEFGDAWDVTLGHADFS